MIAYTGLSSDAAPARDDAIHLVAAGVGMTAARNRHTAFHVTMVTGGNDVTGMLLRACCRRRQRAALCAVELLPVRERAHNHARRHDR